MGLCYSLDDQDDLLVLHKTTALQAHGRYIGILPWGFKTSILKCIKVLEKEKKRPVYLVEIAQKMVKDTYWPVPHIMTIMIGVYDLYRNDEVLCDRELNMMTLNEKY